jgi:hypothetical protein
VGKRRVPIGEGGSTCKKIIPAWIDGRHDQWQRRGGAVRASRSPSARRPGRSQRAGGSSSSPWWPRAVVQALVKRGGAAHRRGGRRRQRDVVGAVEAGVLDDGGTGSSHRRLRSSRQMACPRVASNSSFSPPLLLLLRHAGVWTGEWIPLRRLGSGVPRRSRRRLLIAAGRTGYVDDREVLGPRGTPRRRGHDRRGRALALVVCQSDKDCG